MLSRFLFTLALVAASPAMLFSQDIFLSFGQGADVSSTAIVDATEETGAVFVYVREGFDDLRTFQMEFALDNSSVIEITGAEIFNNEGIAGPRWNVPTSVEFDAEGTGGRMAGFAFTTTGINQAFNDPTFDPDYDPIANAFLLARIDYEIVGEGLVNLSLAPEKVDFSFINIVGDETIILDPVLAGARLMVGDPVFSLGDVNLDGAVNFSDISPFIELLSSKTFLEQADIDQNGTVNFLDISPFISLLSGQ